MQIWKLERNGGTDYDQTVAVVVIAHDETDARNIAHDEAKGDQSPDVWYAPSTAATLLGPALPGFGTGIVVADYWAG
jgi:hypothetical protein